METAEEDRPDPPIRDAVEAEPIVGSDGVVVLQDVPAGDGYARPSGPPQPGQSSVVVQRAAV